MPPAKGFKAEVRSEAPESGPKRTGSLGRAGGGRPLSEHPDQIIKATVNNCQSCGAELGESGQQIMERSDKIDIPPLAPLVIRVERYGCRCPQCGQHPRAAVPIGMESGSPFGNRSAALVTTMRSSQGISYGRMNQRLSEVFGLEMSEGAIAHLLSRVKAQLPSEVDGILQTLRSLRLVGSDETNARGNGKNQWKWVF